MTPPRTPQAQIDLAAYDKASDAEKGLEAHERVCAERYDHIRCDISEMKAGIKELTQRHEVYHRDNSQKLAAIESKSEGERGLLVQVLKFIPTLLMIATLVLTVLWHK